MKEETREKRRKSAYHRSRGAVSVFLTIILVPCIITVCLFDDVCRVQLSQAQAASAADLALYSLMADYDKDLKEKYGFVASVQDMGDEKYNKAEGYFKDMMNPGSNSGNGLVYNYLVEKYGGAGGAADFLKTDVIEEVTVSAAENGALGDNPALIEDGIVEFMKYRGIPEIASRLINLSKHVGQDFVEAMKDTSDNDKKIVEAKEEYGEKESELLKQALYVYIAIKQYENKQADYEGRTFPSEQAYKELETKLSQIHQDLKSVTEIITRYYSEADGVRFVGDDKLPGLKLDFYNVNDRKKEVGTEKTVGGVKDYYFTKADYDDLIDSLNKDMNEDISALASAAGNIVNACANIDQGISDVNWAIYCKRFENQINQHQADTDVLINKANHLMYMYAEIEAAKLCKIESEAEEPLPDDWKSILDNNYRAQIISAWKEYICPYNDDEIVSGSGHPYNNLRIKYYDTAEAKNTVEKVNNRLYTFESKAFNNEQMTIGTFANRVNDYISDYKSKIDTMCGLLNIAIEGGPVTFTTASGTKTKNSCGLNGLLNLVKEKQNALDQWDDLASETGSAYSKQDQTEIDAIRSGNYAESDTESQKDSEDFANEVDEQSVNDLKSRLESIKTDLENCKTEIDELKYGGSGISALNDTGAYISVSCPSVIPKSGLSLSVAGNTRESEGYAASLIVPGDASDLYRFEGFTTNSENGTGNNPVLATDTPVFYKYLKEKFKDEEGAISDSVDDAENKLKEFKDKAKNASSEDSGLFKMDSQASSEKGSGTIGSPREDGTFGAGTIIRAMVDTIGNIISDDTSATAELRDGLYVTEYAMDMFSYATLNNEGRYRRAGDDVSCKDYPYTTKAADWNYDDKTQIYENQSLTNYAFNTTNNALLLGENEYLLFGKGDVESNAHEAYKSIFTVREVLDLTAAFLMFWSPQKTDTGQAINQLANVISGVTHGVVPAILIKTVIIMALGTLEACNDTDYLKKGAPTTLWKGSEEQWAYALNAPPGNWQGSDLGQDSSTNAPEDKEGFFYSDYIYLFLLLNSATNNDYQQMLLRLGDLVEKNMQNDFDLSKSQCYFKLDAGMQVKPLMLAMPIANSDPNIDVEGFRSNAVWCQYDVNVTRGYS